MTARLANQSNKEGVHMSLSQEKLYTMMFREYPDVVTVNQMSRMLGICEKAAYRLLKDNTIGHFRIGRTYKIPKPCICLYLQSSQCLASASLQLSSSNDRIAVSTAGNPQGRN